MWQNAFVPAADRTGNLVQGLFGASFRKQGFLWERSHKAMHDVLFQGHQSCILLRFFSIRILCHGLPGKAGSLRTLGHASGLCVPAAFDGPVSLLLVSPARAVPRCPKGNTWICL